MRVLESRLVACAWCAIFWCGTGVAADLFSIQPDSSSLTVAAQDMSADAQQREKGVPLQQVPMQGTANITSGLASSAADFQLSIAGLQVNANQSLSQYANSFAGVYPTLIFTPNFDVHYELSGSLTLTPPADVQPSINLRVSLGPQFGQPAFFGANSGPQNVAPGGQTTTFNYGQLGTTNGSLSGTLWAGTRDLFFVQETINGTPTTGNTTTTISALTNLHLWLRGDLNGDGSVGFDDLVALASHFGGVGNYSQGDIDGDGRVTFEDLVILAHAYGARIGTSAAQPLVSIVPEPLMWCAVMSAAGLTRRRSTRP